MDSVSQSFFDFLLGSVELNGVSHPLEVAQTRPNDAADLQEIWVAQAVANEKRRSRYQHRRQVGRDDWIPLEKSVVVPLGDNHVFLVAQVTVQLHDIRCHLARMKWHLEFANQRAEWSAPRRIGLFQKQ